MMKPLHSLEGEPGLWQGWPCSSLALQVEGMMESTTKQWALRLIQIICLKWLKPHFYTRENDWPRLIWEMEVCSRKVNNGWSEGHVLAHSVAADVFSISVKEGNQQLMCQWKGYVLPMSVLCKLLHYTPCLFSLPLSLCINKYFRRRDILCRT